MTKKIMFLILIILFCLLIAVSGIFAWFFVRNKKEIYGYSGNIDLDVAVFYGKDNDNDGILNFSYDNINNELITYTRAERLKTQYVTLEKSSLNSFQNIFYGKVITYKIVILNQNNSNNAKVSVNFADMRSYFYNELEYYYTSDNPSDNTLRDMGTVFQKTLNNNTSRLWFSLIDMSVDVYKKDDANNNSISEGYSEIIRSSKDIKGIDKIDKINNLEENDNVLYNYSGEEKFFDELVINSDELMEINFSLACEQSRTGIETYTKNAPTYYLDACVQKIKKIKSVDDEKAKEIANNYINDMCNAECKYLFTDSLGGQNFQFNINYIYIKGTQI